MILGWPQYHCFVFFFNISLKYKTKLDFVNAIIFWEFKKLRGNPIYTRRSHWHIMVELREKIFTYLLSTYRNICMQVCSYEDGKKNYMRCTKCGCLVGATRHVKDMTTRVLARVVFSMQKNIVKKWKLYIFNEYTLLCKDYVYAMR